MRNLIAILTIFLSLLFTSTSQASPSDNLSKEIVTSKTDDELAFNEVMKNLFTELNDFVYANGMYSDSQEHRACLLGWLVGFYKIQKAAVTAAGWAAGGPPTGYAAGAPAIAARNVAAGTAGGDSFLYMGYVESQYDQLWGAAWDAATDAARTAARRRGSAGEIESAARLAAFKAFLKHFKSLFEAHLAALRSFEGESHLGLNPMPMPFGDQWGLAANPMPFGGQRRLAVNPMTNLNTFHQFIGPFQYLAPEDRNSLGLHVFTSQLTFPQLARQLIASRFDPNSILSIFPREVMMLILWYIYNLPIPLHQNDLLGDGACG